MDGEETLLFFSNRRDWELNPNSSVEGSGANHYPRAPARELERCNDSDNDNDLFYYSDLCYNDFVTSNIN